MLPATLPFELLDEISKCIEGDHGTLYSCALVNKQWHYASIPKLWREPFYCKDSTKILINCLFAQDKDFFRRNCIELPLGLLLDKPPMHNYGMFATYLDFDQNFNNALDEIIDTNQCLRKRLLEFVLEYSIIRGFAIFENNCNWLVSHHGFDMWFQKLGELTCNHSNKSKFFHRVANTCKNIQTLRIYFCSFDEKSSYGLVQLIKAQKQIKKLILHGGYNNPILSDNLKEALSIHSQSIVHYEGRGETGLDSLIGTFCNLKILKLELSNHETEVLESIKSISFPNIETVDLYITYQSFLSNMSEFIKVNGKNLKNLHINGDPEDKDCLGELFQSISQYCQNLERLSIFYNNELDKWLLEIFKNCDKLQYIRLKAPHWKYIFNGDTIITTLNQSLPRCLEDIHFVQNIDFYDRDSLNVLIDNWRGPYHFIKIIKTLSGI